MDGMEWKVPRTRIIYRDVPVGGDRTLRVGILHRDGKPLDLLLALGDGSGPSWRERPELGGLTLPEGVLSALVLALLEVGDTDLHLVHPVAPDVFLRSGETPSTAPHPEGGAA